MLISDSETIINGITKDLLIINMQVKKSSNKN